MGATIRLAFGPLRADRPALESRWDVLLGVVAELSVSVDGRRLLLGGRAKPASDGHLKTGQS
jgi:hypothetical protein